MISLEELKRIELDILKCVDKYCRDNDLRYSLGGGTMLGAIRHKGFIPWDDDIDIMMPRPDYDKFVKGFSGYHPDLICGIYETDSSWPYAFCKVYNNKTYWKEHGYRKGLGVFIDVFPIDGYPSGKYKRKFYILKLEVLKRLLYIKSQNCENWKRVLSKPFIFFVPFSFLQKQIKSMLQRYPYEKSKFAGASVGAYAEEECYPRYVFDEYMDVDFEGIPFMCISKYDIYLKQHYGDYMKLPSMEDREFRHLRE